MANELSYVTYDYQELVRQLQDRLKAKATWKDTYASATGETLIELQAYVANLMLYYIERRAEECYIGTANNKSSIVNLVRLLNYTPKRNVSAIGNVQFSIATSALGYIYIDQYTRIKTAAGVEFITTTQGTIEPGQTDSAEIVAIQGTLQEMTVYSDGSLYQEVRISSTQVENNTHDGIDTFRVFINGKEWTKVSSFLSSGPASEHYILRPELDDTVTVVFGDSIQGKTPSNGDEILIRYIESDGVDGNVYELDKVTTVVVPTVTYTYVDTNGITQTGTKTLTVTNTGTIVGGDDAESAEEIREEAPNVFKTGDRLVTKEDFESFLYNYPSVAEASVWGENEEDAPNYDMFNTLKIVLLLQEWQLPTTDLKAMISTALRELSMLTVKYEYVDAVIFNIIPVIDVIVNKRYTLSNTQAEIEAILQDQFILGDTASFAEHKRLSNLVQKVDNLTSVNYIHMVLEIRQSLTASDTVLYDTTLSSSSIKAGTVKLYVGTTHIATDLQRDDSSQIGDFVLVDDSYSVVGTVDYSTGVVSVEVLHPDPGESVYVRYQQDNDGDVLVDNEGICKLHSVDITSIAYAS